MPTKHLSPHHASVTFNLLLTTLRENNANILVERKGKVVPLSQKIAKMLFWFKQ